MTRTAAVSAVPKVEIVGKLAGLFATFDDGRGANPDADDTHLMLHAGDCNFVAYVFDDSIRCKATVRKLGVSDSSRAFRQSQATSYGG
ncbi:hypothetical protein WJX75_000497 [Coccomyxa subellipsoidea]|uniref:Uncharacterized protein n=1 Tax=Coccomyxa subellipsoidea TaxID=248742 RepID=A0ABR2YB92_9CHLO